MYLFLLLSTLMVSASAVPQDPAYDYLEGEYGTIPFKIDSDTYYPSDWQRVNGDPHGQAAEEEAPDPLGDETLSFDFPNRDGEYNVYLWTHGTTGIAMIGSVTSSQLLKLYVENSDFGILFRDTSIEVYNETYGNTFSYTDSFSVVLDGPTGARIFSLPELHNIQFEILDYVFIIIGSGGIYPPSYDVTGNLQQALSVTMWEGDITQLGSLMGQVDGYWIFAPAAPSLGDHALAKAVINGVLGDPFLVRKNRHLGRYKTCWHYSNSKPDEHAVIGNFSSFIWT